VTEKGALDAHRLAFSTGLIPSGITSGATVRIPLIDIAVAIIVEPITTLVCRLVRWSTHRGPADTLHATDIAHSLTLGIAQASLTGDVIDDAITVVV
jgi:hypothetical protein